MSDSVLIGLCIVVGVIIGYNMDSRILKSTTKIEPKLLIEVKDNVADTTFIYRGE